MHRLKCTKCITHGEIDSKNGATKIVVIMWSGELGQYEPFSVLVSILDNVRINGFGKKAYSLLISAEDNGYSRSQSRLIQTWL